MREFYFANKIICVKHYSNHGELGCNISRFYYLDNRIYLFKYENGKYIDLNGNKYDEIDIEAIKPNEVLLCENCELYDQESKPNNCKDSQKTTTTCIGIINIKLLTNFLNKYNKSKILEVIDKYNSDIGAYYTFIDMEDKTYNKNINKINSKVKTYFKK